MSSSIALRHSDTPAHRRRLVVNADDFGRSQSINAAVIRAHREGILTSASLMVNEPAYQEAVALARENPGLGVGLHLTLLCGHSALSHRDIPGLVNRDGEFSNDPVRAGFRYFARNKLHEQLRQEICAQFKRFQETGLPMDHVNGHLHMHFHPVVFRFLMDHFQEFGIRRLRMTRDRFWLNMRLDSGRLQYRITHALIYALLSARFRRELDQKEIRHTERVFGLMQDSHVDERFFLKLLQVLPAGDSEVYSHPSLDTFRHEFEALVSPRVKEQIQERRIQLIRYQDL